jgi:hypothetical protein
LGTQEESIYPVTQAGELAQPLPTQGDDMTITIRGKLNEINREAEPSPPPGFIVSDGLIVTTGLFHLDREWKLSKKPAYGYQLRGILAEEDDHPAPDPGTLYRTSRQPEEEELVRSTWDTGGTGPARRIYELTNQGLEYLHAWAVNLRHTRGG